MIIIYGHMISEGVSIPEAEGRGCIPMNVLAPIKDAMKGNLDAWSGMVRVELGGLRNLTEWVWNTCDEGGTVLKSGDLALGMDCDT